MYASSIIEKKVAFGKEFVSEVHFEKLQCNQVKMDTFDKLEEKGISIYICILNKASSSRISSRRPLKIELRKSKYATC